MSDVKVIRHLLANSAPLIAMVPAARIAAGTIPQGTPMPAIEISHISGGWGSEISQQSRDCIARVQVTVHASSYPQQKQVMQLVRGAVPRTHGTVNGVAVTSIRREPDGPDLSDDDAGIYMQTQDFMVAFTE